MNYFKKWPLLFFLKYSLHKLFWKQSISIIDFFSTTVLITAGLYLDFKQHQKFFLVAAKEENLNLKKKTL